MSARIRAAAAVVAPIVAGGATLAVTQLGGIAHAAVAQLQSGPVGRSSPDGPLEAVLGPTRSLGSETPRAAHTCSTGGALTSRAAG
jgi:hypothetical protein